ncbi:multicopper oxidase domain-containing protein [Methyloprofundus sedimenti]|uniref:multicopper oxidase domain-containing protein n=1 Tax=Methyloprofundus sedimenti TaxID=1420851 RepID=UPI00130205DB|nr:multicopper oxidase domain-containing protein [Methyloprofundus sedimenti]
MSTNVQALTLTVTGVNTDDTTTPVSDYRWTIEEDTSHPVPSPLPPLPSSPDLTELNSLSLSIHKSNSPVVASGNQGNFATVLGDLSLDPAKRYFISVLPDSGYSLGGAPFVSTDTNVTVKVNAGPLPPAQISVQIFEDNKALSGIYDVPAERGLPDFTIQVYDVGGQLATDVAGNPLQTITTDVNGRALVKNLAPGIYNVTAVPNDGQPWVQTVSIGGSPFLTTWVQAGEPPFFAQGGLLNMHVAIGFLKPFRHPTLLPDGAGTGSITGRIVGAHGTRPPSALLYPGIPVKDCYVGLNLVEAGTETAILLQKCDPANDGTFLIEGLPPGTYQLVAFDLNLDYLMAVRTVTIPVSSTPVAMGDLPITRWLATLQGTVFEDSDLDGRRNDATEIGIADQAINIRHPDGSIAQATTTGEDGKYELLEIIPLLPDWWIVEVDYTRFKATGATFVIDDGGPISPSQIFPFETVNAPQKQIGGNYYRTETGPVLTEGMIIHPGQLNIADFGKAPFDHAENGGLAGIVYYATTRAENNPQFAVGEEWEPGIPGVQVNLYVDSNNDDVIDDLDSNPGVTLADVDNYPFQWWGQGDVAHTDYTGTKGPEDIDRNNNGVFDFGDAVAIAYTDSFDDNAPTDCVKDGDLDDQQVNIGAAPGTPTSIQKCAETLKTWNQMRPTVFDGGWAFMEYDPDGLSNPAITAPAPIASGQYYIVEAATPPGLETVKEEDKNVDFGDVFDNLNVDPLLFPVCVGDPHLVPGQYSLFDLKDESNNSVPPFNAGNLVPLCDRKKIFLSAAQNAVGDFYMFSAAPKAGRIVGKVISPFANQVDPNDPNFGGPLSPSFMPVQIQDYKGVEISTVHTDRWGGFSLLAPSTYNINVPSPSGVSPNVVRVCANTPSSDSHYNPNFAPFCFNTEVFPGKTAYVLAPVASTVAFVGAATPADCEIPVGIPRIEQVNGPTGGPYVVAAGDTITITSPDSSFGGSPGSVTVGGVPLIIDTWADGSITAHGTPATETGQLVVTHANGNSSITGITLTVGGAAPAHVAPGGSIQTAINNASPGDLILVEPGTYTENIIMWKPVRIQGYGPDVTIIDASDFAANKAGWLTTLSTHIGSVSLIEGQRADFASEQGAGITVMAKNAPTVTGGFGMLDGYANARIDGFEIKGATWGGAILVNGYARALEISNNQIDHNSGSFAGAIRSGWASLVNVGSLLSATPGFHSAHNEGMSIHNNDINQNGSLSSGGGVALYTGSDGYAVNNNFICGNYAAANGSAVAHHGLSDQGLIANNQILFNEAFGEGAILIDSEFVPAGALPGSLTQGSGSVTVVANQIQANLAGDDGGAMSIFSASGQDIVDADPSNDHIINVFNNMIIGNAAGYSAGAIGLSDTYGPNVRFIHNTIFNNTSTGTAAPFTNGNLDTTTPFGAGIVARGNSPDLQAAILIAYPGTEERFTDPVLDNNIIWHNESFYWSVAGGGTLIPNPVSPFWDLQVFGVEGASMSPRNSNLSYTSDPFVTKNYAPAGNIATDPTFVDGFKYEIVLASGANALANFPNISPLTIQGDYHIGAGSPAKNTGLLAHNSGHPYLTIDYDTEPRPEGAEVDMGADEVNPLPLAALDPEIVFSSTRTGNQSYLAKVMAVDPNGGPLTFSIESVNGGAVPAGMVINSLTGVLEWPTPMNGSWAIEVKVSDGVLFTTKTLTIVIDNGGVNIAPVAIDQDLNATKETALDINLSFTDPDGPTSTFTIVGGPSSGTLGTPDTNGAVTYTPDNGFTGIDSFTWHIYDGTTTSNDATVTINVKDQAGVFIQCPGDLNGDAIPDPKLLDENGIPTVNDNPDYRPEVVCMHITGSDGFTTMADGKTVYGFGFNDVTGLPLEQVMEAGKLAANGPAPTIVVDEGDELWLNLTNIPMIMRPDLFDAHTVHYHGYAEASSYFDGLPDASVAVHAGATFTYYKANNLPGTYMYHCHAEATEHMQMGMLGNLYVRPKQNYDGAPGVPQARLGGNADPSAPLGYVYNDGDGSTAYDVEYPIQIGSLDGEFHDASLEVQPLPFEAMFDNYPLLNGRGYPDTINPGSLAAPADNGGKISQPVSSLIEADQGDRILLRISNLNVTRFYTLATNGNLAMRVVGKDARQLKGPTGLDLSYSTQSITLGGGESVDVIIDTGNASKGTYLLYTTNLNFLSNNEEDFGGMMTEIIIK